MESVVSYETGSAVSGSMQPILYECEAPGRFELCRDYGVNDFVVLTVCP